MIEIDTTSQSSCFDIVMCAEMRFRRIQPSGRSELFGKGKFGEHRKPANPGKRFVMLKAFGELGLSAHRYRGDRLARGIQVQRVETVEELEFHTAPSECLIQRCDHDIAHPGRHFPENCSSITEKHLADQECHHAGTNRGPPRVAIAVTEHQVIHSAHHGRIEDIRMCAVPNDPVAEVLVVDRREAMGIGDQLVGDDAAYSGDDQR